MDLGISGKTALVCASSRGLGKGCAMHLADAGCKVIINGRNAEVTNASAEEIRKSTGADVRVVLGDVSTAQGQSALLEACPNPDILVNNNGGPPRRDFRELDRAAILEGVVQNMVTPIELIQAVIGPMASNNFGRIVNITSLSVYTAVDGLDLSSGARAGLTSFLAGVARTYAKSGITINQILPGKMDTDRLTPMFEAASKAKGITIDEARQVEMDGIPAKRLGTPDEFGALCAFLCSAHGGYITGRNILVDGGLNSSAF